MLSETWGTDWVGWDWEAVCFEYFKRYCNSHKLLLHTATKIPFMYSFWELRGLSPNFHIHVSVSDLNIPRIGPHIFLQQNRQIDCGNISLTDTWMRKMGLCNSFSGNMCFEFSLLVLCSADQRRRMRAGRHRAHGTVGAINNRLPHPSIPTIAYFWYELWNSLHIIDP